MTDIDPLIAVSRVIARVALIYDAAGNSVMVDTGADAQALTVINTIRNRVHRGQMFSVNLVDLALAGDASIDILIQPNRTDGMYFAGSVIFGSDGRIELFENTVFSDKGTLINQINCNRVLPLNSRAVISQGPTVSVDGTKIVDKLVTAGGSGQRVVGTNSVTEEFIFADKNYLLRLTNLSQSSTTISISLGFYEDVRSQPALDAIVVA